MHVIAAKAVAFGEALQPSFARYARGRRRQRQGAGRDAGRGGAGDRLGRHRHASDAGRSAAARAHRPRRRDRRSSAPASPATRTASRSTREKPTVTSGIRLGSPAATTRGFGADEFRQIGRLIGEVLRGLGARTPTTMARPRRGCAQEVPRALRPLSGLSGSGADLSREGGGRCAVRSAGPTTPRSRIRGRPTIAARSAGGASARIARRASRPSSGCSCAT